MSTFDDKAATWDDDPGHIERARVVSESIKAAIPLGSTLRVLEYGAGTGQVSQALQASVGPITMADTSAGMRDVMEEKVAAGVIVDARVSDLDLASESDELTGEQFDLIVTVMTLHHVPDLDTVLSNFFKVLTEGGHLAIVDLDEEAGTFHDEGFQGHHGFDHEALAEDIRGAGFSDVSFRPCHEVEKDGRTYPLFLATATRP